MGIIEDLERLKKLKEDGILSKQEFEIEKQKILKEDNKDNNLTNKKRIKNVLIISIVVILILVILPISIIKINSIIDKNKEVQVPNLIGKSFEEAQKELSDLGLQIQITYDSSDNDKAIILEQNREEGYTLKKGDIIQVKALTQEEIERKKKEEEERQKKLEEAKKNGYYKSAASDSTIIGCAKTLINDTLKSSSTAIWGTSELVDEDNYGRSLVYVSLEAQNGFGGYQKLNYFVILQDVKIDGNFTYLPYTYKYEITSYLGNPYQYVTDYKEGNIVPVIQTFLDNNKWNERKEKENDKDTTNTNGSDESDTDNYEIEEETSLITIGEDYNCTTTDAEGFIRFEKNKKFTMELEYGDIESFIRKGTYSINGDKIILTVTYDSTDENLDNSSYTEEIIIDNEENLKYITEYDTTIIFEK